MTIYLDNAATTFPKPESVYTTLDQTCRRLAISPGRGSYSLALEAGRLVYEVRETVAEFFNIPDPARVIFTANATEAINLGLFGLLQAGDRVVSTTMEHNAVSRPLHALASRGVEVVRVPADATGQVSASAIHEAATDGGKTARLVVLSHCSNVTGSIQPVEEIGPWCRQHGILFMVDAAQSAGLLPIDVRRMGIDLLAAAGHKGLFGPTGTGFLYLAEGLHPMPLVYGGTGGNSSSPLMPDELPERLECGTLNTPALAGLQAGIEFVRSQGLEQIFRHKNALLTQLKDGLQSMPALHLHGPDCSDLQGGVLSFTVAGHDPSEIGFLLDVEHGICIRTGLHCAPDAHRSIGTLPAGTLRVSPGAFNTAADIDALLNALDRIFCANPTVSA
ncbi:cysteine desulfurase [Syntrophotalea acetylenivorans]|uniref:cysteine desulfurase n=1 Tax=Syntrophotalea acetylenivorans TaxID=1842532 RepID=A0A1L3GQ71_9BACT|nr:aminotransferase class V-fold PLP-dependent enzyme [Syntrophotalea acetylenivorans]APG28045.1 cysteine desulfurase [Syntrophotalea acetylenivorans]